MRIFRMLSNSQSPGSIPGKPDPDTGLGPVILHLSKAYGDSDDISGGL